MPSLPKIKVEVGGADVSDDATSIFVTQRENKLWDALIPTNDELGRTFLGNVNLDDEVAVNFKWKDGDDTWRELFKGRVVELQPDLSVKGRLCAVKAYGYGIELKRMRTAQEYGTESKLEDLGTLREILTDNADGIIPRWVLQYEGEGGTLYPSGYALGTDYVWDCSDKFKYLYFPFSPVTSALADLCTLLCAMEHPVHWIVLPSKELCIAPIGSGDNHDVEGKSGCNISSVWPSYGRDTPIEVTQGMVTTQFSKTEIEANYILINGRYEYPTGEYYTEGHADEWEKEAGVGGAIDDDPDIFKVGKQSIKTTTNLGSQYWFKTGSTIDITKIGTKNQIPILSFWARKSANPQTFRVKLSKDADNFFYMDIKDKVPNINEWIHIELPIGPYATDTTVNKVWSMEGTLTWSQIERFGFLITLTGSVDIWFDDLRIEGIVTRVAYSTSSIVGVGAKMKLITDSLAKCDSLIGSDDSSPLAMFAYAELKRSMTTPLIGTIQIPLDPTLLPGQKLHIHAGKIAGGFKIDGDLRITELKHQFTSGGAITDVTLTDDLSNSYPLGPNDLYSAIMKATNPDFQDRDRGSLKAGNIDVEQTVLIKAYP